MTAATCRAIVTAALGAAAFLAWRGWQSRRFQAAIGASTYDALSALQPTIRAPVIRLQPPTLAL